MPSADTHPFDPSIREAERYKVSVNIYQYILCKTIYYFINNNNIYKDLRDLSKL